ncbi:hypothetical protein B0O95_10658 [Mycetohabitans endofungorum]|uniref:Uncharacterized protein n=1 Tax=Mycetohabitans endofungorum TaxID=417203 RepID=A0A2P5KAB7_9BURK|nr:hypothetical protein B0O95_10658 [Mycetohabitans endofungorum]
MRLSGLASDFVTVMSIKSKMTDTTLMSIPVQFVVGTGYLLRERCQFAQFCYAIDGRLATE